MNIKNEINSAAPVIDRLNAAIRENPLAAGLIGAGVAWMLMGGAKGFGAMAGAAKGAADMAGSAAATAGSAMASGVARAGSATASGLKSAGSGVAGSAASLVPDINTDTAFQAAADVGAAVGDRLNSATATGREYGAAIQSRLSESLEKQPLLLGAIGLALGAGIASTFATTTAESELMGEQGTAAREKLQGLTDDVKERAEHVVSEIKDEADRQGLTAKAAKRTAAGIGEKVKTVASAGRDSVAQRFAPTSS